ncbi:MAG: acetylglutamate kinase, partial [Myxococcota bacterium]
MSSPYDREIVISALHRALPYIRLYRGRIFVVKVGGALCADSVAQTALVAQLAVLCALGIRVVLVHGGGPQTTELCTKLGIATELIDGRRVSRAEFVAAGGD